MYHRYPSKRNLIYGHRGMVATTNPLASDAGISVLKSGGNAFDAVIAAAAVLTVVEPTSNGIGGDAFAILWSDGKIHGINGSGRTSKKLTSDWLKNNGFDKIPQKGALPVTVPGGVSVWAEINEKFGRLPLSEVLKPAVEIAKEGFAVQPTVAKNWKNAVKAHKTIADESFMKPWFNHFTIDGRAPKPGEVFSSLEQAETLELIGATNGEAFYRGVLAEKIAAFIKENGGLLDEEDLKAFRAEWVEPISVKYRGYDVWEIPPNGHGINVLMALGILENLPENLIEDSESVHRAIEAMKLAFEDGNRIIGDPHFIGDSWRDVLKEDYLKERAELIGENARLPLDTEPKRGGTVYLAAADGEGNMISFIQSNYMGFGSGLVVPGTGIALHNRGCDFVMEDGHPNSLAPGKRPYHTIIPGFLTKDGNPVGPFGVMGAYMQPQGHLQVMLNTIEFGLNPQDALDAPRWQWVGGNKIQVEKDFPSDVAEALAVKGHQIEVLLDSTVFGRGQIIWKTENGALCGGTEKRADGYIATL
jgi:gamma-glutamyltranspeptidase/glutathione hydrolase